jgi:threonine aldolase
MDRRQFLAAGGFAAAVPLLGQAGAVNAQAGRGDGRSRRIDFTSDGLGLSPAEYARRLSEAAGTGALDPDNYSNGGVVADLERTFAALLGKQAAMYVPTGTLANHLAIRKLAGPDRRVLVQAESHLYNDSGDCATMLSGLNLIPLSAEQATMDPEEVRGWVERSAGGRVETNIGVISIENPVRRQDHRMVEFGALERICGHARERGIRLHLDGARMFNLPLHSGRTLKQHAALFDTVYVSLWKHFDGASGAILAGDADFIEGLFHMRRMFGGSLPQAWPLVATVADCAQRYEADYARAWQVAGRWIDLLQAGGAFTVRRLPNGTSRFHLSAPGVDADRLRATLLARNIVLPWAPPGAAGFPIQVNPTILRTSPRELADVFHEAARA